MEAYNAALLPYQDATTVRTVMEELRIGAMEAEVGEDAEAADRENARLIAQAKERKREVSRQRKIGGSKLPKPSKHRRNRKIRRIK